MSSLVGVEFEPLHAAHSIENVQFILNFSTAISDADWPAVLEATHRHKNALPGEVAVTSFTGTGTVQEGKPGIARRRVAPTGAIEEELVVTRGALVYHTSKYDRWVGCWNRAREIFDSVLSAVPGGVVLSTVGQSVVDKGITEVLKGQAGVHALCGGAAAAATRPQSAVIVGCPCSH